MRGAWARRRRPAGRAPWPCRLAGSRPRTIGPSSWPGRTGARAGLPSAPSAAFSPAGRGTLASTILRPMSTRWPYCTPLGQVLSQLRQVRQRSRCSCVLRVGCRAFEHLLHQVDAAARAVQLVAQQLVGGAGGGAKAAVHALAQDGFGLLAFGGAAVFGGELGLHGALGSGLARRGRGGDRARGVRGQTGAGRTTAGAATGSAAPAPTAPQRQSPCT
jgi:hypothetical protein